MKRACLVGFANGSEAVISILADGDRSVLRVNDPLLTHACFLIGMLLLCQVAVGC